MKIVHVNLGGPPVTVDGIATVVETLVEAQRRRDDDVETFTDRDYDARGIVKGIVTALRIRRQVIDGQPDVVHMHSVYRPAHAVLAVFLRRRSVPYVVSPHSGLAQGSLQRQKWRKRIYIALFERRLLARAGFVHCLSSVEGDDVRSISSAASIVVVPNPGPSSPSLAMDVIKSDHLLTLCRFDVEQKGLDVLVEIARLMPTTHFRVFGETDINEPARAAALIASAPSNVSFEAPVRGEAKEIMLRTAQAYIQPSRWEGQSISVLEAFAAGVPCIVSRYIARTLGAELAGLAIVIDDDPSIAASEIVSSLEDRPKIAARAEQAKDLVLTRYSADTICQELEAAYTGAIGRCPQKC
ncbi:MAG: glycosyltransferase [Ilumatobacteraceae bacterium]